jgi:TetR/AcrR family transcriptional regulator, regulator of cefoperazone and chloramphenicol sensitivity
MDLEITEAHLLELLHPGDEQGKRKTALLETTFDVIAEVGFEGLRTRAVAERAGVNIATLHYYFPSKQALIEGLAQYLGAKFVALHGPAPEPSGYKALDALRQEFSDGRYYQQHQPKMLIVMQEFGLRGERDPEVQKIVNMMYGYWLRNLERIVTEGLAVGTFRPELDREETQVMLQCLLAGASVSRGGMFEQLQQGVERWLLTNEVWEATRGAEQ